MFSDTSLPTLRVCCGPRCGAEPGQRSIYAAIENAAGSKGLTVRPTLCQGVCGSGVTLVLPDGTLQKARDRREAIQCVTQAAATIAAPSVLGG